MHNKLRALREATGLSQKEVSRILCKDDSYIRLVEKNTTELKLKDAYILSKIYGVKLEDIHKAVMEK